MLEGALENHRVKRNLSANARIRATAAAIMWALGSPRTIAHKSLLLSR